MAAFNPVGKAPGVYAIEIDNINPIAGVSTSVTAIVGPALAGPINTPMQFTNWTDYVNTFGVPGTTPGAPGSPYFQGGVTVYTPMAVKGFFDNGGNILYFVRASNASPGSLTLNDQLGASAISIASLEASGDATNITVAVDLAQAVQGITVLTNSANLTASGANTTGGVGVATIVASSTDPVKFYANDVVTISGGGNTESATIRSIRYNAGGQATVQFSGPLTYAYPAGTIRLADISSGTNVAFRVLNATSIEPGTILNLSQGTNKKDVAVVKAITPVSNQITIDGALTNSYSLAGSNAITLNSSEFTLTFANGGMNEIFNNLSMDPRHSRYFGGNVINSGLVTVSRFYPPPSTVVPKNLPATNAATHLIGGAPEDISGLLNPGTTAAFMSAIDTLNAVEEINILCVPDRTDQAIQAYMIAHCELKNRFAILDPKPGILPSDVEDLQRGLLGSEKGFAAFYYPGIQIANPAGGTNNLTIPPSGHIAGAYASTDDTIGVHKAPANIMLRNALDVERVITADQQGPLNDNSINVIRTFKNQGVMIYGARTISTSLQWRYVSTRRLVTYVELSLIEGTQLVLFQPNNEALWGQLSQVVAEFLTRVWNTGALMGLKAADGYAVQCDAELNPPASVESGVLTFRVSLYPAPPAEFIVFQIYQTPGGSATVQES